MFANDTTLAQALLPPPAQPLENPSVANLVTPADDNPLLSTQQHLVSNNTNDDANNTNTSNGLPYPSVIQDGSTPTPSQPAAKGKNTRKARVGNAMTAK